MGWFFTKAALQTFGGTYAVLPLCRLRFGLPPRRDGTRSSGVTRHAPQIKVLGERLEGTVAVQ